MMILMNEEFWDITLDDDYGLIEGFHDYIDGWHGQ
jgi:hypothetical protein